MPSAIWLITYDLDPAREAEYLAWFHDIHIPEKLARPGYTWAAHYRADSGRHVALFGGAATRIFYDPSPAQLAPKQPPETRDMMSCRQNPAMAILAGEWTADASGTFTGDGQPVHSPAIVLAECDPGSDAASDMDFSAWLVQDYLPALTQAEGFQSLHKLVASTGTPRHTLIHEFQAGQAPTLAFGDHIRATSLTATRLWPE